MRDQKSTPMFALGALLGLGGWSLPAQAQEAAPTATNEQAAEPAPAPRPSTADAAEDDVGEVIVTARRVEEKLQDVPISITVFNQQELANRNVTNATDLANFTPSLSANSNFGSENTTFAIRGFVQDLGTAPSVGTYFADVVVPRGPTQGTVAGDGVGPGSFFDLQNVQVLKGPQGTLFGRNTTGGAILLVPQKPTSSREGYLEASAGNFDMRRIQGAFNTPIGENLRFRLAADHQEREGYIRNVSGIGPDNYNDIDYTAVRASLVADLAANVENYTIASYSNSDTNGGGVQKLIACDPSGYSPVNPQLGLRNFLGVFSCAQLDDERERGLGFYDLQAAQEDPRALIEQWQLINTTSWNATDTLTVKNIASYAEFKNYQKSPKFGTNWDISTLPAPYPQMFFRGIPREFVGIYPAPGGYSADQSTYTEELQLQGEAFDNRLSFQAGAYLEWSDPLSKVGNQSPQLASCTDSSTLACTDPLGSAFTAFAGMPVHVGAVNYTVGETTFRSRGLYTQSTYTLAEQLKLTGGLRYTWDKQSNEATRITYQFPVTPPYTGEPTANCTDPGTAPSCTNSLSGTSKAPTWVVGLDYTPITDVLLYAKYARGYRSGGVFTNAPIDHRVFEPEKVDNFEVGFKTTFHEIVRGTFNVAAFYNDFSDQQLMFGFDAREDENGTPAPVSPTTAIINAGKSRIYGLEVESTLIPAKGLSFQLSYAYLNTEIRKIDPVDTTDPNYQPAAADIASGSPLVLSPKHKASVSANYVLPLDARLGKVSLGLNYVYTAKQTTTYVYQDPAVLATFGQNYGELDSRDLLSGNIGWERIVGSPFDVLVFATNLTDEKYYQYVPGLASNGIEFATLGEPRMVGARLRYHFGS